jgi:hypothetical protein
LPLVTSALQCIHFLYGKISPNRGGYSRRGLCLLYHSFCSPTISSFRFAASNVQKRLSSAKERLF